VPSGCRSIRCAFAPTFMWPAGRPSAGDSRSNGRYWKDRPGESSSEYNAAPPPTLTGDRIAT
jgi:hypothetical protein